MSDGVGAAKSLDEVLEDAWRTLKRGCADRRHVAHTPTLVTIDDSGAPTARTVVLRAVDAPWLRFHTDVRADKWRQLKANPAAAVHVYLPKLKVQLRLSGRAELHESDAISRQAWDASQGMSRQIYRISPGPGSVIEEPLSWTQMTEDDAKANFGVVRLDVQRLEWLYLQAAGHQRARFERQGDGWRGHWLVP